VISLTGWSQVVLIARYQHVMDFMRLEAAEKVGTALWGSLVVEPAKWATDGSALGAGRRTVLTAVAA
jgi:hypothetical protein